MTFEVEPTNLVTYSAKLRELHSDVAMAKNYVSRHGDFSFHQSGIIGSLAGRHAAFLHQLEQLHDRLLTNLWRSSEALLTAVDDYRETDTASAAKLDASYPASPRPVPKRD